MSSTHHVWHHSCMRHFWHDSVISSMTPYCVWRARILWLDFLLCVKWLVTWLATVCDMTPVCISCDMTPYYSSLLCVKWLKADELHDTCTHVCGVTRVKCTSVPIYTCMYVCVYICKDYIYILVTWPVHVLVYGVTQVKYTQVPVYTYMYVCMNTHIYVCI